MFFIGIDIGGTKIKGILREGKKILSRLEKSTPKDQIEILRAILYLIDSLIKQSNVNQKEIGGIGLAIAGILDLNKGKIIKSKNIPAINGLTIRKVIKKEIGLEKVRIDNDANCFLLGEIKAGSAQGINNILGITLGSGVGGGIWLNNKIYSGNNGTAAEFGWMIIREKRDNLLSLEDLCSRKWFLGNLQKEPKEIYSLAKSGDKNALNIWQSYGENLGIGLSNLINIFNPSIIILGGGISQASQFFRQTMKKKIKDLVLSPLAKKTKIIKSKAPNKAGAIGASYLFGK